MRRGREALGRRWPSLFITPVRAAVEAADYQGAAAENRRLAGEGLSRQAFALRAKILDVHQWLQTGSAAPAQVVEAHPELSFAAMAGAPLRSRKSTWAGRSSAGPCSPRRALSWTATSAWPASRPRRRRARRGRGGLDRPADQRRLRARPAPVAGGLQRRDPGSYLDVSSPGNLGGLNWAPLNLGTPELGTGQGRSRARRRRCCHSRGRSSSWTARRAHDRGLITDELIELRYQASLSPPVRDSWAAMFPEPRQRWVDDLALAGAELAAISAPVLLVHGRDDRVVPWRVSSAQLVNLLPDSRLHVLSGCGHWTMIEKTADFLAVVQPFLGDEKPSRTPGNRHPPMHPPARRTHPRDAPARAADAPALPTRPPGSLYFPAGTSLARLSFPAQ